MGSRINYAFNSFCSQLIIHYQLINYANNSSTQGGGFLPWPGLMLIFSFALPGASLRHWPQGY